ncbi:MAG TPA: hypothetical protein VLM85_00145 [Polyangiaceae bacterium]|nr:hypothetical protein [Polyangiaceae bacterium]
MPGAKTKRAARWGEWRNKVQGRLARSGRVFLLGVIAACGVEVLVDWNSTLFEINSLRTSAREKAVGYVGILGKPVLGAVASGDNAELERITQGVFDDPDAAYVRVCDASGAVVYDRMRPEWEPVFHPHAQLYEHLMKRDVGGMLKDPDAYVARVAGSRYRDFAQVWTDATAKAVAAVSPPKATSSATKLALYQDHLRDESHARDDSTAWSLGVLRDPSGNDVGAILVAFDMRRIHDAVHAKYLKGFGIIAFFVGLIVVQNVMSRRDKLRLLDLQTRYASAKKAMRDAMPAQALESGGVRVAGALDQAKGPVDGMVWDAAPTSAGLFAMIADPDGDGIDAAAVGLHVLKVFRQRCESDPGTVDEMVRALGAATADIPLTRPIGVAVVAIDPRSGEYQARHTAFASLRLISDSAEAVALGTVPETPPGVVGPVHATAGTLSPGASLMIVCAGLGENQASVEADAVARYVLRAPKAGSPLPVEDAATWARGRSPALAENDLAVVAISRS